MKPTLLQQSKLLVTFFLCLVASPNVCRADTSELVKGLLFICVGGGSEEKLTKDGKADVALTLKALREGTFGAGVTGGVKVETNEWQGLVGGINAGITQAQADQADKVRDCIKPYRDGIVQQIMKNEK